MVNLADAILRHAKRQPQTPAFILGHDSLSYAELAQHASLWRDQLVPLAEQRATTRHTSINCVAWSGANHLHLPSLYLACVQTGLCLALLDPAWPAATTQTVLDQLQPLAVVGPDTALPEHAGKVGRLAQTSAATEDDFFLLGFTSGSTGMPKAFIRRQHSWINTLKNANSEFPYYPRVLAPGPLTHGLSFYAMVETLHSGGSFFSLPQFFPAQVQQLLYAQRIQTLVVVPTMLQSIIRHSPRSASVPMLKLIITAGAKLSTALRKELSLCWPSVAVSEYYGASELSFVSVSHSWESAPEESLGRSFAGVEISIRDTSGMELKPGVPGEVYVRSKMLAEGYIQDLNHKSTLNSMQLTALRSIDGFASVGDVGKLDSLGNLYLLDRLDNMIISGGLNVYPAAVEAVLNDHPLVTESVVIGLEDAYWGEKICACLQLQPEQQLGLAAVRCFCADKLPGYQIPRCLLIIEQWPLTSSGKIARAELTRMAASAEMLEADKLANKQQQVASSGNEHDLEQDTD